LGCLGHHDPGIRVERGWKPILTNSAPGSITFNTCEYMQYAITLHGCIPGALIGVFSITIGCPVTHALDTNQQSQSLGNLDQTYASSLAKKNAASATSSGLPSIPHRCKPASQTISNKSRLYRGHNVSTHQGPSRAHSVGIKLSIMILLTKPGHRACSESSFAQSVATCLGTPSTECFADT
jgi:hypothetical protein